METQGKIAALNVAKIASDLTASNVRIDTGSAKLKELSARKEILSSELREQERTKKSMRDNLDYRESIAKRDTLLKRLADTKRKLGLLQGDEEENRDGMDDPGHDGSETARGKEQAAERAIQKAEQSKGRLIQELYRAKGKMESVQGQIRTLADKLSGPNLLDIEKRYRKAFIQHETVELAVKDLEAYHKALDKALQVSLFFPHIAYFPSIDMARRW